jgi:hypothetical protein
MMDWTFDSQVAFDLLMEQGFEYSQMSHTEAITEFKERLQESLPIDWNYKTDEYRTVNVTSNGPLTSSTRRKQVGFSLATWHLHNNKSHWAHYEINTEEMFRSLNIPVVSGAVHSHTMMRITPSEPDRMAYWVSAHLEPVRLASDQTLL